MPLFELTDDQKAAVKPELNKALKAAQKDQTGVVLGQVYDTQSGKTMCQCTFIAPPLATEIKRLFEKYFAGEFE